MTQINTVSSRSEVDPQPTGVGRLSEWMRYGWRLFRRAPMRLFGLLLSLFVVELLIQVFVPIMGIPISKVAVGMIGGLIWLALYQLHLSGQLQIRQVFDRVSGRWAALTGLAMVQFLTYLLQVAAGALVLGPGAIELLVFGQSTGQVTVTDFRLGLVFASAVPLSTLLMFAAPLLLINRYPLGSALLTSIRLCIKHAVPIIFLAALTMLIILASPAAYLLPILLLGPWLMCVGLAAYLDIGPPPTTSA